MGHDTQAEGRRSDLHGPEAGRTTARDVVEADAEPFGVAVSAGAAAQPDFTRLLRTALMMSAPATRSDFVFGLQRLHGNDVVQRLIVGRAPPGLAAPPAKSAPAQKATLKVVWNHSQPPGQLSKVFKDHPVNWAADVSVNGKVVSNGDGSAQVDLPAGAQRYRILVKPKAAKPDNYFLAKSATVTAGTTSVDIKLGFNRENRRFTEHTWAIKGLDTAKVGKVKKTSLLGHDIVVNELVGPTVERTNQALSKLNPAVQAEVTKSIWSMGGYNPRTTSEGTFSNHSTGCAVDINPHEPTRQNWHMKKSNATDVRVMNLFKKVVQLDPAFSGYDPWKEKDPSRILEASRTFNERFPRYLLDLVDEAFGPSPLERDLDKVVPPEYVTVAKNALKSMVLGPELVQSIDPKALQKAADAARTAKKTQTQKALQEVAANWTIVRAWVEGVVVWKDKNNKEQWAYASDYKKAHPGEDPTVMRGMVSLHPQLVKTMTDGGWTWLVDFGKDYMHFEDRAAETALKK